MRFLTRVAILVSAGWVLACSINDDGLGVAGIDGGSGVDRRMDEASGGSARGGTGGSGGGPIATGGNPGAAGRRGSGGVAGSAGQAGQTGKGASGGGGGAGARGGDGGSTGTGGRAGAGGSAGAVGSGGFPGTGGRRGSGGGGTATGGRFGSGGSGASGGGTELGGATGAAGHPGVGGAVGTGGGRGGYGGGGVTGFAGQGGAGGIDSSDLCAVLESQYGVALATAQECSPTADPLQCQQLVSVSLSCPGCRVRVNDTGVLDALRTVWSTVGCASVPRTCPAIACVLPGVGVCTPSPSGGGRCVGLPPS